MRIVLASDHTALALRGVIAEMLRSEGHDVIDLGPFTDERTDYPLYGAAAARTVAAGEAERGIVICGTGVGIGLAANTVPGIRCCTCSDSYTAIMSRLHNDANMLSIGARVVGVEVAKHIVTAFLETPFEGGRHQRRVNQLLVLKKDPGRLEETLDAIRRQGREEANQ